MCWPTGAAEEQVPEPGPTPVSDESELWVYPTFYPQGSEMEDDDPSKPLVTEDPKDTNSGES